MRACLKRFCQSIHPYKHETCKEEGSVCAQSVLIQLLREWLDVVIDILGPRANVQHLWFDLFLNHRYSIVFELDRLNLLQ